MFYFNECLKEIKLSDCLSSRAPLYGGGVGGNSLKLDEAHDIRTKGIHPTSNR